MFIKAKALTKNGSLRKIRMMMITIKLVSNNGDNVDIVITVVVFFSMIFIIISNLLNALLSNQTV